MQRKHAGADVGLAVDSASINFVGTSPFGRKSRTEFSTYHDSSRRSFSSDRWTYGFSRNVEDIVSAASGGVFLVLFVVLIIYFSVSGLLTLIFSIDGVNQSITSRNFSASFAILGFIIALITRDWMEGSGKKIIGGIKLYRKFVASIQQFHNDLHSIFRAQFIDLQKVLNSGVDIPERLATQWIALAGESIKISASIQQLLALYSLRIFLEVDNVLDYEGYDITEAELAWARRLPKDSYGHDSTSPIAIVGALLRSLSDTVHGISSPFVQPLPTISQTQVMILNTSLDRLNIAAEEIMANKLITEPAIFRRAYMFIIIVFLGLLVPLDIYSSVDVYTPVVAPLVMFLYTLPLILSWYANNTFSQHPNWTGPDFYEWRRNVYNSIFFDEDKEENWLKRAKWAIFSASAEVRRDFKIVKIDNALLYRRVIES
jgi:hypothetical protein